MIRCFRHPYFVLAGLAAAPSSCIPPPGKPLADGCYYAKGVPVLKIQGRSGTLLVPGDVRSVVAVRDQSAEQAGVTFTPGFHLRQGPPLTAHRLTNFPSSSMMMMPFTERPTILVSTDDPMGVIELAQGPSC